jgi:ribonuclease D
MPEFAMVSTDGQLAEFRGRLARSGVSRIAIDFEGESNLHCYGERLCLIQVYDRRDFCLIDPFGISGGALKDFLEDESTVKLGYGSDSDCKQLYKQYGIKMKALYDLKILVDLLELERKGLDAVLEALLGVRLAKKKEFQMYNWTLRPIRKSALEYALTDVEHLFDLQEKLLALAAASGMAEEARKRLEAWNVDYDKKSVPTIKRDFQYQRLGAAQKRMFDQVYDFRDKAAKALDLPPNMVIDKPAMFALLKEGFDPDGIRFNAKVPDRIRKEIRAFLRTLE